MINPSTKKEFEQIKFNEINWHERAKELKEFAEDLLKNGYKIVIVESKEAVTYFNFTTDETYFGYVQQSKNDFWKVTMSSVHQGHKRHGSGTKTYGTYQKPSLKDAGRTITESKDSCRRRNLKPTSNITFGILNYKEVIL